MNEIKLKANVIEQIYINNKFIGGGTSCQIFQYDEDTLVKLYYQKLFGDSLLFEYFLPGSRCNRADIMFHGYNFKNSKNIKRVKELISRQELIKMTILPLGILTIDEFLVGSLLHYFKNYVTLYSYSSNMSVAERKQALEIIREKLTELQQNYIYPRDLWELNIMIHPETKDIELIDLDDSRTIVTNYYDRLGLRASNSAFNELYKGMIKRKH